MPQSVTKRVITCALLKIRSLPSCVIDRRSSIVDLHVDYTYAACFVLLYIPYTANFLCSSALMANARLFPIMHTFVRGVKQTANGTALRSNSSRFVDYPRNDPLCHRSSLQFDRQPTPWLVYARSEFM